MDHGYEYHHVTIQASLQKPPAEMMPGHALDLTATFSHNGTVQEGGTGIGIRFWYSGKGINMQPAEPYPYFPWDPALD